MKRRFTRRFGRWGIILGIVFAASMLMVITVWAAGSNPFQQNSGLQTASQKQAQLRQIYAQETAAAKSPHGPKPQQPQAKTVPITSCPNPPWTTGILATQDTGGFHDQITNSAIVAPNGGVPLYYVVYAGALRTNLQQGVMIVMQMDYDSCAASAQGTKITLPYTISAGRSDADTIERRHADFHNGHRRQWTV